MRVIVPVDLVVRTIYQAQHHLFKAECRLCRKQFTGPGYNGAQALVECVVQTHLVKDHGATVEREQSSPEDAEQVECDEDCGALEHPGTLDEYRATLTHYKDHPMWRGCSHGNV